MLEAEQLALLPMWYVAFLLSLTAHEAAHALAANMGGDPTAAHGGQVTLNPLPHILREPFGTVLFPLLTYITNGWMMGWASAPYDPLWQARHPKRAAWMALAGPAANWVLVLIAAVLIRAGLATGFFQIPDSVQFAELVTSKDAAIGSALAIFLSIVFSLNLLLGCFNLLPIPPLDGNSAVGIILPEKWALKFMELSHNRMLSLIGLLVAWQVFGPIFQPIFGASLRLIYPWAVFR